jgi:hypothetical protein
MDHCETVLATLYPENGKSARGVKSEELTHRKSGSKGRVFKKILLMLLK